MTNYLMKWDLQSNSGNPTKSVKVNELVKKVKNAEVRKEGKASAARRATELSEFHEMLTRCRDLSENHIGHHTGAVYFLFQFCMVAKLDGVTNFKCEDIMVNMEFPSTLK